MLIYRIDTKRKREFLYARHGDCATPITPDGRVGYPVGALLNEVISLDFPTLFEKTSSESSHWPRKEFIREALPQSISDTALSLLWNVWGVWHIGTPLEHYFERSYAHEQQIPLDAFRQLAALPRELFSYDILKEVITPPCSYDADPENRLNDDMPTRATYVLPLYAFQDGMISLMEERIDARRGDDARKRQHDFQELGDLRSLSLELLLEPSGKVECLRPLAESFCLKTEDFLASSLLAHDEQNGFYASLLDNYRYFLTHTLERKQRISLLVSDEPGDIADIPIADENELVERSCLGTFRHYGVRLGNIGERSIADNPDNFDYQPDELYRIALAMKADCRHTLWSLHTVRDVLSALIHGAMMCGLPVCQCERCGSIFIRIENSMKYCQTYHEAEGATCVQLAQRTRQRGNKRHYNPVMQSAKAKVKRADSIKSRVPDAAKQYAKQYFSAVALFVGRIGSQYYACSDISDELYNEWLSKVGETKASAFCKTDSAPSYWVINKGKLQNDRDEFMRQLHNDSSRHNNGDASLTLT